MTDIHIKRFLVPLNKEDESIIYDWIEYLNATRYEEVITTSNMPKLRRSFKDLFGYKIVINGYYVSKQF